MVFELRTAGDPPTYVDAVRDIVRRADARLPVADIRTRAAEIDRSINDETTLARLCTMFALLALTVACVGLYGTWRTTCRGALARSGFGWRWGRGTGS
jgi:macrolide transport system ATP-binding/permease protein